MFTIVKKEGWEDFAKELEENSDICWSDAEKPTEYNPFKKKPLDDLEICISEFDTLHLSEDSGDELLRDEFIERCALIKPKKGKNILSNLKKENTFLKIINTKYKSSEETRRLQVQALLALQQASMILSDAKKHIDEVTGWDEEHIGFEKLETALREIEKVKLLCLEDFEDHIDLKEEEIIFKSKIFGDDENGNKL